MASTQKTQARRALVVYGSETGNAQDVAEEMGRLAVRLRFDTEVAELDAITLVCDHQRIDGMGVDACRNDFCSTMWCSWRYRRVARVSCHQIVRHFGGRCAVHDSDRDACNR
jgi:hypothetical protein